MTTIDSPAALDQRIKAICDVLRRSNCAGALQYVPELSWLLFLRFLDEREAWEAEEAEAIGSRYRESIGQPFRWQDWAAPEGGTRSTLQHDPNTKVKHFLETDLLPYLHELGASPDATPRQRLITQIVGNVTTTRVDTERNFFDVVDRIHEIRLDSIDAQHQFALSQAYEGLLLKMGEKKGDGGEFYTPREVIRAMVQAVEPRLGETVYDPCCGTGGFLAQSYEYMRGSLGLEATGTELNQLGQNTFYGREKDDTAYPITLANLVLHGIDYPRIWHGNTLTRASRDERLFDDAPELFDVILTNPPFGGKEGLDAQTRYSYKTSSTQVLFVQEVIDSLVDGGRAGMVIDEGMLFRTDENAFVETKQKLLDECNLHTIVSLPQGVFVNAGAGVKTNLMFFERGQPTETIWYYELRPYGDKAITKKARRLKLDHFTDFLSLLPSRSDSEHSWTVSRAEIEERNYDLKAVNPNRPDTTDTRTPAELLKEIERHGRDLDDALADLRVALQSSNTVNSEHESN